MDGDPTVRDESIGDDHFWAAPWLRRRRGWANSHLEGSGRLGDGAGRRRRLGEVRGATGACWGGVNRRRRAAELPRPRQRSPAMSWRRLCAQNRGAKGSGECGEYGDQGGVVSGGRGAVARHGRVGVHLRMRRSVEEAHGQLELRGRGSALPAVH